MARIKGSKEPSKFRHILKIWWEKNERGRYRLHRQMVKEAIEERSYE